MKQFYLFLTILFLAAFVNAQGINNISGRCIGTTAVNGSIVVNATGDINFAPCPNKQNLFTQTFGTPTIQLNDVNGTLLNYWYSPEGESSYIGYNAGNFTTTAIGNIFIGYYAGNANTSGTWNTFIGRNTGRFSTTATNSVAVGIDAGQYLAANGTVAIGSKAGRFTTGQLNTFVGLQAGNLNTTGEFNTYIGEGAGQNNVTGSSNVFIGNLAGFNELTSNKLYIDNSATTTPLIYGDFVTDKLTVGGTLRTLNDIYVTDNTKGFILKSPDNTCYRFTVANGGTLNAGVSVTCP